MAKAKKQAAANLEASGSGYWKVDLRYNKSAIVEASNEAEAWSKYKEVMGIRHSDHEPTCGQISEEDAGELNVDEFGIIHDEPVKSKEPLDGDES